MVFEDVDVCVCVSLFVDVSNTTSSNTTSLNSETNGLSSQGRRSFRRLQFKTIYIYIYIYIEREREREMYVYIYIYIYITYKYKQQTCLYGCANARPWKSLGIRRSGRDKWGQHYWGHCIFSVFRQRYF